MISNITVVALGFSQLICWGVSFYLIGVFGDQIMQELNWSRRLVFGGFSVALVVMGLVSPMVGRLIDRFGGGYVMASGSGLCAIGCITLSLSQSVLTFYLAWLCIGLAMRAILYDAAFATLVRIGGSSAQRPIAQITLLGGLASTIFWPVGFHLSEWLGWRGALLVYAGLALLTIPIHLSMTSRVHSNKAVQSLDAVETGVGVRAKRWNIAALYALIMTLITGLNSGMSAHMISVLIDLGLIAGVATSITSLRGIGQSSARLVAMVFGGRLHPVSLNLLAIAILPACFLVGFASGESLAAAALFAFAYGAGNGLVTITRGTMPLVLFDHTNYGVFVGKLLVPSFIFSAAAPVGFALVIEIYGANGALYLATSLSFVAFAAAVILKRIVIE